MIRVIVLIESARASSFYLAKHQKPQYSAFGISNCCNWASKALILSVLSRCIFYTLLIISKQSPKTPEHFANESWDLSWAQKTQTRHTKIAGVVGCTIAEAGCWKTSLCGMDWWRLTLQRRMEESVLSFMPGWLLLPFYDVCRACSGPRAAKAIAAHKTVASLTP